MPIQLFFRIYSTLPEIKLDGLLNGENVFGFIEFGNVTALTPTHKMPLSYASYKTNLIQTDGKCISLAYLRPTVANAPPTIKISQVPIGVSLHDRDNHITIIKVRVSKVNMWQILHEELEPALSQVLIEVQRSAQGISGVALDNIRISSCSQFGKSNL